MDRETLARFHDAKLVGVSINQIEKNVRLSLLTSDGLMEQIDFLGVIAFRINDFIFQNIISQLIIVQSSDINEIFNWIEWLSSLSMSSPMFSKEAIQEYTDQIKHGELILLVVEPSWGAEAAVLCRRMEYEKKGEEKGDRLLF